jgi:hypothetical protein
LVQREFGPGLCALFGIAVFAAGNAIIFAAFSASTNGNQVIHGQFFRQEFPLAVIADPFADLLPPPRTLPQFTGFGLFLFLVLGRGWNIEIVHAA